MPDRARPRPRRGELVALGLILLLALVVRLAWLGELRAAPDLRHPPVDGGFMLHWAHGLATGDWTLPPEAAGRDPGIRQSAYIRAPGYAYVLAGLHRLTGGDALAIRQVQMGFGLLTLVVAWALGRRLAGPAFGLTWAGTLALCWIPVYFEGGVDETWVLVLGLLLVVLAFDRLLERPTLARAIALGALAGGLALFRANVLLLVPVLAVLSFWALGRPGRFDRKSARKRVLLAVAVAGAAAVMLFPALARNYRVAGALVPVTADAGINLYRANNDAAVAYTSTRLGSLGRVSSPWEIPDIVTRLEAETGRRYSFAEASRELGRKAFDWMAAHPGTVFTRTLQKLALFFGPHEIAHSRAVAADRAMSPLLRRLPLAMPHALAGALLAVVLLVARARGAAAAQPTTSLIAASPTAGESALLMIALVAVWTFSFLPFLITSIYRAPIVPILLAGLALVLVHLVDLARQRSARALVWGSALVVAVALASVPIVRVDPGFDKWHFDRGLASLFEGRTDAARASFEQALAANPRHGAARLGLGKLLYDAGDAQGALPHFRAATGIDATDSLAQFNLGLALTRLGRWAEAEPPLVESLRWSPTNVAAWQALGVSRDARGLRRGAREAYEKVLERQPGDPDAANNLAWILATAPENELRDGARAVRLAEPLLARGDPSQLDTLAAAYAEAGRFEEAIATAERALARLPPDASDLRREIEARFAEYRAGQPHRSLPHS